MKTTYDLFTINSVTYGAGDDAILYLRNGYGFRFLCKNAYLASKLADSSKNIRFTISLKRTWR